MKRFRPRFTLRMIMISIAVVTVLTYSVGLPVWRYYQLPANTRAVLSALRRPVRLPSSGPMPLMTMLKGVKGVSVGVPIFVDPIDLASVNLDENSTVTASAENLTIKDHLEHSLKPMGLSFFVKDGLLMITTKKSADLEVSSFPNDAVRP